MVSDWLTKQQCHWSHARRGVWCAAVVSEESVQLGVVVGPVEKLVGDDLLNVSHKIPA